MDDVEGRLCTVSIDFGTSRTGYAFAFRHNKGEITCKEPGGTEANKTHTALLLDADKKFVSFGRKALEDYYQDEKGNLLFEKFKMNLYKGDTDDTKGSGLFATATNGTKLPLVEVIAEVLAYVKREAIHEINRTQLSDISMDDIQWMLTIPAIWKDIAKGVMRKAAFQAGLISEEGSDRLQLVLEPEAACAACQAEQAMLHEDDTFMVLDCGGGTVDITMHRLSSTTPVLLVDELAPPSGGPWGSTYVDQRFEAFLREFMGDEAFGRFQPTSHWVEMMKFWEEVKAAHESPPVAKAINMSPIFEVLDPSQTLQQLVAEYNARHGTDATAKGRTTLMLPGALIQSFFNPVMDSITEHVRGLLKEHEVRFIFLVGGFADSRALYGRVRDEFERGARRVVVPKRPGLAVVQGAAVLGLDAHQRFASRLAKYNYGVKVEYIFDPANPDHRGRATVTRSEGGVAVTTVLHCYLPIVQAGARVRAGEVHTGPAFKCLGDDTTSCTLELFSTPDPSARFTTDVGMVHIGSIQIESTRGDELVVQLEFGRSELRASALNRTSGVVKPSAIDYDFSQL